MVGWCGATKRSYPCSQGPLQLGLIHGPELAKCKRSPWSYYGDLGVYGDQLRTLRAVLLQGRWPKGSEKLSGGPAPDSHRIWLANL